MKCFYPRHHIISEYRTVAREAGRALIQLYVHRLCSSKNLDHEHQAVIDALDHLSDAQHDGTLQPLSTIVKSIREPSRGSGYRWEMGEFDILWISELWMHHVWLRRTQLREYRVGGIITEGGILDSIKALFEKEGTPPPSAVRSILYGFLAGISSSPLPLDSVLNPRRNGLTREFFEQLGAEMIRLAGHDLQTLQITLGALVPRKHGRVKIVILCSNLLQRVAKHTAGQALVRSVVYLLFQIACHRPIPGIQTRLDPLNLRTINRVCTFIQDGDEGFIGDLMSFFAHASWSEGLEGHILQAILKIPDSGLSAHSQTAIITMFGPARWSLVEGFDYKELVDFIGRLQTDMIVQRIIEDESVYVGWMRILLLFTFRPPPDTDTRPLWKVLLSTQPRAPESFSRDLPNHIDSPEKPVGDLNDGYGSERHKKKEEALWMKLFWSSRFFEMDCRPWSDFNAATEGLRGPRPVLFQRLERLCFGLEEEAQVGPDPTTARTKAYTEMTKLTGGVHSPQPPQGSDSPRAPKPRMNPTRQNQSPPDSPAVVPMDTPPIGPTTRRRDSILSQIWDSVPHSSPTATRPAPSSSQQRPPHFQAQSESPIPIEDDGDQQPPSGQSDSGGSEPPDAGPQSVPLPPSPDIGSEAGSPSGPPSPVE